MFRNRNPEFAATDPQALVNERVQEVAKARNCTMAQVALAWVLKNPTVTAPIVGTTRLDSLQELIGKGLDC
jgi:aryl-alcohol dehydrogenase-like predicted oxidoreductase